MIRDIKILIVVLSMFSISSSVLARNLPLVAPEDVRMSSQRLGRRVLHPLLGRSRRGAGRNYYVTD